MSWILVTGLAGIAFLAVRLMLRGRPFGWEVVAAALLLGVAGYALQARPGLAGAPKGPSQEVSRNAAALVDARQALAGKTGPATDNWLIVSDALARHGQFADAAGVLVGAVDRNPNNGEAWLALGNALVAHSDNFLTPASAFAYRRAAEAVPDDPGPPFFLGFALAQSGRFAEARGVWADLLARTPADAPWRADLAERLARLERFMAAQQGASTP